MFEKFKKLVAKIHKAGISIIAGTDMMNPFVYPGFSLHDELELYVECGLTPAEELRTATINNPAVFLDKEKEFGTLAEEKRANLVILNAKPLKDISYAKRIGDVLLKRKFFNRSYLDKFLTDMEIKQEVNFTAF